MKNEKINRILEIYFRALHGEAISVKVLANAYGVSPRSIGRDIATVQMFLSEHRDLMQHAELTYSHKDKSYHLNSEAFLKNKELFALVEIMLGCRCFQKDDILRLIAKLKHFTTVHDREMLETLIRKEIYHYHAVQSDCDSVIDNLWYLIHAIAQRKVLTITYYKMSREKVQRKIKPISLLFNTYYFYLVAYMAEDSTFQPKYFRVDRITAITTHRTHFPLDKAHDFDEGDLREKNQFMFPGKTEKIRFSFSGPSVQAILDRLPTASVIDKKGNTSILEAEVNRGRGIVMYLLSQGAWVRVLSPQSLVDEMQMELQKMLSAYTTNSQNLS